MILLQITAGAAQVATSTTSYVEKITNMAIDYAPKIIGAFLFYVVGSWLIKKVMGILKGLMARNNYDPSLQSFLISLVKVVLLILLLSTVLGIMGVPTTMFGGLLAGAAIGIGAAMNGSLGNLAGGVMMLIFKPFKVGDMIEAQGVVGVVSEQGVFNTTVLTAENKTVFVPNGPLSTGIITNYTTHGNLRVDLSMAIDASTSIDAARSVAIEAMLKHPKVISSPTPEVSVLKVADAMVTLAIRPYCVQADYWDVYFGVQELVKKEWDEKGIAGPKQEKVVINKQG